MHKGRLGVAVLLLFAAVFCFSGCNIKSDEKAVFVRDTDPAYIDLLRDIAPDCTVRDGKGLSSLLSSVDGEDKAFAPLTFRHAPRKTRGQAEFGTSILPSPPLSPLTARALTGR